LTIAKSKSSRLSYSEVVSLPLELIFRKISRYEADLSDSVVSFKLTHVATVKKFTTSTIAETQTFLQNCEQQYDAIILHILTNDVKEDDPDGYGANIDKVIKYIKKRWPSTKMIVSLTTPRADTHKNCAEMVNAIIKQHILQENDEAVTFVEHQCSVTPGQTLHYLNKHSGSIASNTKSPTGGIFNQNSSSRTKLYFDF
jgi:hypothetical protein